MNKPILERLADRLVKHSNNHEVALRVRAKLQIERFLAQANEPPILVYHMAKIGSSSICQMLRNEFPGRLIPNIHSLATLETVIAAHRRNYEQLPNHLFLSMALKSCISKIHSKKVIVITGFRDPVARQLSNSFNAPELLGNNLRSKSGLIDEERILIELKARCKHSSYYDWPLNWFSYELEKTTGFKLNSLDFDPIKGYAIVDHGNFRILFVTQESVTSQGKAAVEDLIGTKIESSLQSANVRVLTPDADTYRRVAARFKISQDVCEEVYNHETVRKFYSAEQIAEFKKRWQE